MRMELIALSGKELSDIYGSTDMGAINSRRAWIIDQLAGIIRNQRLPRADTWIKKILDWLTIHGLFMIKKKSSKTPFSTVRLFSLSFKYLGFFIYKDSYVLSPLHHCQTNFGKVVETNCWSAWVTCAIRLWW